MKNSVHGRRKQCVQSAVIGRITSLPSSSQSPILNCLPPIPKPTASRLLSKVQPLSRSGITLHKTPEVKLGLTTSYELTRFELDVLRALMQSTGDEDAAHMLGCTKANIRWHVSRILEKTGYRTRMELLIAVAQKNLIIVTPDKALDEENF